jgi:cytochrome P450
LPLFYLAGEAIKRRSHDEQSIQRCRGLTAANPAQLPPTLFSKLFKAGAEGLSDKEIFSDTRAYIVAGSDVTANTLTFLVWNVSRDSSTKQTLMTELETLSVDFHDEQLKNLPYLSQVIDEMLGPIG